MKLILSDIHNLDQHISVFLDNPARYRPNKCPHCGKSGLWAHGVYYRNASCEKGTGCSAPILRFRCPPKQCGRTCSVLPQYIPPRRWYHWAVQQLTLMLLMAGYSLSDTHNMLWASGLHLPKIPSQSTIYRWQRCLRSQFDQHYFFLRDSFPKLALFQEYSSFWQACFLEMMLSTAMLMLNKAGHPIP